MGHTGLLLILHKDKISPEVQIAQKRVPAATSFYDFDRQHFVWQAFIGLFYLVCDHCVLFTTSC